jgi:hypothetical protein
MLSRMHTPLTIITGASRGLGLALAEQRLREGHRVLAIARRAPALQHASLTAWTEDLADPAPVALKLELWLGQIEPHSIASASLVNNAGVVSALAPLGGITAGDLSNALRVGLEAPMLLASAFLRASCCSSRRVWAGVRWPVARRTARPRPAWTIWRAPSRSKRRRWPTAPRRCRWRPVSSTPRCRRSCAAPTRRRFPNARASSA